MKSNLIREEYWVKLDCVEKETNKKETVNVRSYEAKEAKRLIRRLRESTNKEVQRIFHEVVPDRPNFDLDYVCGLYRMAWEKIDVEIK